MTRKQKKMLTRILISAVLFLTFAVLEHVFSWAWYLALPFFLVPYFIIGYDVLWRAVRNILHGQIFDENFLMVIATIGALATAQFEEAVFVMLFYQVGEFFQGWAVGKSRKSIAALMDIRPDYANLYKDGEVTQVDPYEVAVDDIILIKPGEKIPLDGVVTEGNTSINTVALTGEALPKDVGCGDAVVSGCVNLNGLIKVRVTSAFAESTVSKILELIEESSTNKAVSENFITKFAKYYTPIVVISAVLLAVLPPLFVGNFQMWFTRALTFLVISCPCALVISIPLSFFGGIGAASKHGVLVKGSCYLEALAKTEMAVFDKTGTLTEGSFHVTAVHPSAEISSEEFTEICALCENYSNHPIAKSVKEYYQKPVDAARISHVEEIAGFGIRASIDGKSVLAGNDKLMQQENIAYRPCHKSGTILHLAIDGKYAGHLVIADTLKSNTCATIKALKDIGVHTVMLTGDKQEVASEVAKQVEIDAFYAELLPAEKVQRVEELFQKKSEKGKLLFVGDGINDAPVLSRADVGIAMGGIGSDASIEAADIVIMDDDIGKLKDAMQISKKTLRIVHENIVFALGIKFLFLLLGALGFSNMWMAVFADVGVSVIAILNAMRTLRFPKK